MRKRAPWAMIALVFTLIALGTHAYLALQNYKLKSGVAEKSICNVNATFNCDAVALSPFAQFLGIPVAVWGAATNGVLALFIVIFMLGMSRNQERVERAMFWLSGLVLAASAVMGVISMTFLHNYCLFCLATYFCSAIQFIAIYPLQTTRPLQNLGSDLANAFREQVWIPILIVVIPVASMLANSMISDAFGLQFAGRVVQEALYDWQKSATQNFSASGLHLKKGSAPAKMVIVEFADFLCPHCKHAAPTVHNFVETRSDVEFIFKPFPLDGTCNTGSAGKGDGLRCKLAGAVLCADSIAGKGWIAHDYFFERQEKLSMSQLPKSLEEVATMTGIGLDSLQKCVDSQETQDKLMSTSGEGVTAKIQGTPTFFVNGKILERGQFFPVLDAVHKQITGQ